MADSPSEYPPSPASESDSLYEEADALAELVPYLVLSAHSETVTNPTEVTRIGRWEVLLSVERVMMQMPSTILEPLDSPLPVARPRPPPGHSNSNSYVRYVSASRVNDELNARISDDLTRVLPRCKQLARICGGAGLPCLRRVLAAYSIRNPRVGYSQGLAVIVTIIWFAVLADCDVSGSLVAASLQRAAAPTAAARLARHAPPRALSLPASQPATPAGAPRHADAASAAAYGALDDIDDDPPHARRHAAAVSPASRGPSWPSRQQSRQPSREPSRQGSRQSSVSHPRARDAAALVGGTASPPPFGSPSGVDISALALSRSINNVAAWGGTDTDAAAAAATAAAALAAADAAAAAGAARDLAAEAAVAAAWGADVSSPHTAPALPHARDTAGSTKSHRHHSGYPDGDSCGTDPVAAAAAAALLSGEPTVVARGAVPIAVSVDAEAADAAGDVKYFDTCSALGGGPGAAPHLGVQRDGLAVRGSDDHGGRGAARRHDANGSDAGDDDDVGSGDRGRSSSRGWRGPRYDLDLTAYPEVQPHAHADDPPAVYEEDILIDVVCSHLPHPCDGVVTRAGRAVSMSDVELRCFWIAAALLESRRHVGRIFTQVGRDRDLFGLRLELVVLTEALRRTLPRLHDHISRTHTLTAALQPAPILAAGVKWFLTVFVDVLPPSGVCMVFDRLMKDGIVALHHCALALLRVRHTELSAVETYGELLTLLTRRLSTSEMTKLVQVMIGSDALRRVDNAYLESLRHEVCGRMMSEQRRKDKSDSPSQDHPDGPSRRGAGDGAYADPSAHWSEVVCARFRDRDTTCTGTPSCFGQ